jgi:hypothetical protein
MAVDLKTFKALFPEFCSIDDDVINLWLSETLDYLSAAAFGDCYDRAALYFTAHELAMSQARLASAQESDGAVVVQGGGIVQSASAGGLSVSYATPQFAVNGNADDAYYAQTPYGIKYLKLRDTCIGSGRLAGTKQVTADDQVIY